MHRLARLAPARRLALLDDPALEAVWTYLCSVPHGRHKWNTKYGKTATASLRPPVILARRSNGDAAPWSINEHIHLLTDEQTQTRFVDR